MSLFLPHPVKRKKEMDGDRNTFPVRYDPPSSKESTQERVIEVRGPEVVYST